eukprot:g42773.t1
MLNTKSGPVMYEAQMGVTVLNKNMDYMKAANLQTGQEQNMPGFSTAFLTFLEPMFSPCLSSIEETSESEIDMANVTTLTPFLPEEENEFLLRRKSGLPYEERPYSLEFRRVR